jgi:hypothetical protein
MLPAQADGASQRHSPVDSPLLTLGTSSKKESPTAVGAKAPLLSSLVSVLLDIIFISAFKDPRKRATVAGSLWREMC